MKEKEAQENVKMIMNGMRAYGILQGMGDAICKTTQLLIQQYVFVFQCVIQTDIDYFVGDMRIEDEKANRPTQPVDVAMFGDYCFSLYDIRVVVDNLEHWIERYKRMTILGQEIRDWHDYAVDQKQCGKTYINLFNWLNGCPRDAETSDLAAHERPAAEKKGGNNG